jgi:hypothetical protein
MGQFMADDISFYRMRQQRPTKRKKQNTSEKSNRFQIKSARPVRRANNAHNQSGAKAPAGRKEKNPEYKSQSICHD